MGMVAKKTELQEKCSSKHPAGDRAERHAEAGDPGPHADRRCSLLGVGEGVGEDGQRGREDQGRGQAHQATGHDQHAACCPKAPAKAENPAKATSPIWRAPLRPYRSPRLPPTSSSDAKTRE